MPTIRIDDKAIDVPDGATVLDAARQVGIEIPTLCFLDGQSPLTTCMVCLVKLAGTDRFVPACGTVAVDGQAYESETPEVHAMRREALELLLGDHLGDCEAPCRLAHPHYLDIPRMIRHIAADEPGRAAAIARAAPPGEPGETAPPFERACRRGRRDEPVAIDALLRFAASRDADAAGADAMRDHRPFSVIMGGLDEQELEAFAEAAPDAGKQPRVEPAGKLYTLDEARREAGRCLHCDCRTPVSCRLRHWAERYGADPRTFRKKHHGFRLHDEHASLVFEPGKCIACGLCVQIARESGNGVGMTFEGRGFAVRVKPPFAAGMDETLDDEAVARRCAEACPTAALVMRDHGEERE
ncbi:MAG: 2Fe-2S iron-sulfur cluster binding domain-containing protein [Planctomycetes bacterium]|jgi:ferredoxin|nr:(2Fe-2S)-binding protein [Phycisphaerae bacterium]NBB96266.1 2Fe-2S iron-sulfur cluster binding domain-containing protein [Planctomycetota bacterium]